MTDDVEATAVSRRRPAPSGPLSCEGARDRQAVSQESGSLEAAPPPVDETVIVASRTRARARTATTGSDVPAPTGRLARAPETDAPAYPARDARPVVADRAPVPRPVPPAPVDTAPVDTAPVDTVRTEAVERVRARRRAAIVVAAASVLAVAVVAALVLLLTTV